MIGGVQSGDRALNAQPPGWVRVVLLVVGIGYRRWVNRWTSGGWRRNAQQHGSAVDSHRRPVGARKNSVGLQVLVVVGAALFALQVVSQMTSIVGSFVADDETLIGSSARDCMRWADDNPIRHDGSQEDEWRVRARDPYLLACFTRDLELRGIKAEHSRAARVLERYDALGRSAFRVAPTFVDLWSDAGPWAGVAQATPVFVALTALIALSIALAVVGSADARTLADELSWLYQMPARASPLLAARAIVCCLLKPSAWVVGAPMFFAIARMHGHGLSAYVWGACAALQIGVLAGSVELVAPLALGRVLSAAGVRTVQGVLAFLGSMGFMVAIVAARRLVPALHQPPGWFALLPGASLLPLIDDSPRRALAAMVSIAWVALPPVVAVLLGGRLIARGLVVSPGERSSRRRRAAPIESPRVASAPIRWGVAIKELRWAVRDRRALMGILFPAFFLVPQEMLRPGFLEELLKNSQRAAIAGFGLACYGFAFSATSVLSSEGGALWLLYASPRPLHRILLEKLTLWCCIGLAYLAIALGAATLHQRSLGEGPLHLTMAAGGVILFAFVAAGLGALRTDPEAPARPGMPVGILYLYLALASVYGYVLATESLYGKAVALAFFSLLALALWQKVRNRIPYLLDATARPPPSLDVSDAILIAVAFFVMQIVITLCLWPLDLGGAERLSLAFSIAGALVVAGAFAVLRKVGVPDLLLATGINAKTGNARQFTAAAIAPVFGVGLGAAAQAYSRVIARFVPEDAMSKAGPLAIHDAQWFVVTALVSAPLFEEMIFRGFLYRSLRRSWPAWAAALASGATFAACHPPVAAAPVLVLGVLAAVLVEWSGSIIAPVLLHTTYNAMILSGWW